MSLRPFHYRFAGWVLCCLLLVCERSRSWPGRMVKARTTSPNFLRRLPGSLSLARVHLSIPEVPVLLISETLQESAI